MRNRGLRSGGIHPEILAKFKEIFPQHADLEEYLHALGTRNGGILGHHSSPQALLNNNRTNIEQEQLEEALTLLLLEAQNLLQNVPLSSQATPGRELSSVPLPATAQNNLPRNLSSSGSLSSSTNSELKAAIALSLEPLVAESIRPTAENQGASSNRSSNVLAASPENVDPDNMTYEQLLSLGDTIGSESRGLSIEVIASFPTQKLDGKSRWVSANKSKPEECAICIMEYEVGEEVLTLPCLHLFHGPCITKWLTENKTCPVCIMDISVPQP